MILIKKSSKKKYLKNPYLTAVIIVDYTLHDCAMSAFAMMILFSAKNKGQSTQTYPDQNNIDCAVYEIGISHERNATDNHQEFLALFPIGHVA